jgi:hypothetical protein
LLEPDVSKDANPVLRGERGSNAPYLPGSPDGTVIRIYQELTPEYIKEILDQFMVTEKLVK